MQIECASISRVGDNKIGYTACFYVRWVTVLHYYVGSKSVKFNSLSYVCHTNSCWSISSCLESELCIPTGVQHCSYYVSVRIYLRNTARFHLPLRIHTADVSVCLCVCVSLHCLIQRARRPRRLMSAAGG